MCEPIFMRITLGTARKSTIKIVIYVTLLWLDGLLICYNKLYWTFNCYISLDKSFDCILSAGLITVNCSYDCNLRDPFT
jgi:hypothetical protein